MASRMTEEHLTMMTGVLTEIFFSGMILLTVLLK